jgi:hypothetical protein
LLSTLARFIRDQLLYQFRHTFASLLLRYKSGEPLNGRHGIGNRDCAFATLEKRVIILGVTDADGFMERKTEFS